MVDVSDNRYVANVLHLFLISSSITGTKVVNNAHLWGDFRFSAHCFLQVKHSSLLAKDLAFSPSKSAIDIARKMTSCCSYEAIVLRGLCDQYCSVNGPVLVTYMN